MILLSSCFDVLVSTFTEGVELILLGRTTSVVSIPPAIDTNQNVRVGIGFSNIYFVKYHCHQAGLQEARLAYLHRILRTVDQINSDFVLLKIGQRQAMS